MAYSKRRTWKDCKDEKILAIYNEVLEEAKRLYPTYFTTKLHFYLNNSTSHLGCCVGELDRNTVYSKWGFRNHFENLRWKEAAIIISKYVTDLKMIRATIIHEMAHFVTPNEHHSGCWLARANKIGEKWKIKSNRAATDEESVAFRKNITQKMKYKVICSGCGRIVTRTRMCNIIEHPELWKCGECGAHFKAFEN